MCSYRWFVDHELGPRGLDPDPDPLVQGSIIHRVLERLYRAPARAGPRAATGTVAAWRPRRRARAELAADAGLGGEDARSATARARIEALVGGFLERESRASSPLRPDPELLEASFGAATTMRGPRSTSAASAFTGRSTASTSRPTGAPV